MKRFLAALAVAVLFGCAGSTMNMGAPALPDEWPIDTSKTLQLLGYEGVGSACPVDGTIYTAAHMALVESEYGPSRRVYGYSYSTDEGNRGTVVPAAIHAVRDIAVLYVKKGAVNYYELGDEPEDGDKVYWREYDLEEDILAAVLVEAEVLRTVAGHIVTDEGPEEGASGGCLFNEDGEAVGIVVWNINGAGGTVSIAGFWSLH